MVAIVATKKQISITYSECVLVALVIECGKRMRRFFNRNLWPAQLYHVFHHYLINGTIFGGGGDTEHKMCLIFSKTFV